jgi:hypothetical protein
LLTRRPTPDEPQVERRNRIERSRSKYGAPIARLLVLSYFAPSILPRLLRAARAAGLAEGAPVYIGSYGVGRALGDQIDGAGYRYAPMFNINPGWYWERRRLPRDEESTLSAASRQSSSLAGPLPELDRLLRLPSARRVTWGVELGARFRDELRAATDAGVPVRSWQLDEILAEAAEGLGAQYREFTRGVLRGLLGGRQALGDRSQRGIVWWAHTAQTLPGRRITPELSAFWRILNRASLALVGEEYPVFAGDAAAAARSEAAGQRGLQRGGPVRQALARKYLAGMTPGYHLLPGLGGNTGHRPRAEVNRWREEYVRTRAHAGVAGFAEFDFRYGNNRATVIGDVVGTLARFV